MRWAHIALISAVILACGAFAWSQSGDGTIVDEDCLEQEQRAAVARSVERPPRSGSLRPALTPAGPDRAITAELAERLVEVAEEIDPAMANRLRRLRQRDPVAFVRALQTSGRRLVGMAELKSRDPRLYEFKLQELQIDEKVVRAAERLRESIETGSGDVEHRREDLRTYVRIQIALSIKARVEYLARLQEHVNALEEAIDRDAQNFNNSVEERISELLGRDDRLAARTTPSE